MFLYIPKYSGIILEQVPSRDEVASRNYLVKLINKGLQLLLIPGNCTIETISDLKADLEKTLKDQKETAARNHVIDTVVEKVTENAKFEIPSEMIDSEVAQMVREADQRFQMQGFNLDLYFQFTGMDMDKFKAQLRPEAEKRLSYNLTLEAIVKAENIDVTEEEVNEKLAEIAQAYGRELEELKAQLPSLAMLKEDLKVQKAVDFIVEKSVRK